MAAPKGSPLQISASLQRAASVSINRVIMVEFLRVLKRLMVTVNVGRYRRLIAVSKSSFFFFHETLLVHLSSLWLRVFPSLDFMCF